MLYRFRPFNVNNKITEITFGYFDLINSFWLFGILPTLRSMSYNVNLILVF